MSISDFEVIKKLGKSYTKFYHLYMFAGLGSGTFSEVF